MSSSSVEQVSAAATHAAAAAAPRCMSGPAPSATFDGMEAMRGTEAARESVSARPSAAREFERGLILSHLNSVTILPAHRIATPGMSGGSSVQQLLQLVKKNFIVKARNRRATLSEFLFVLYFLAIVIFLVKVNERQLSEYPSLPSLPLAAPAPLGITKQATNLTYLYLANPPQSPDQYLPQWCAPSRVELLSRIMQSELFAGYPAQTHADALGRSAARSLRLRPTRRASPQSRLLQWQSFKLTFPPKYFHFRASIQRTACTQRFQMRHSGSAPRLSCLLFLTLLAAIRS
jgi:hypothetical protein